MNNKTSFLQRNLSAFIFIIIYILMVAIHLISDSFILTNQIDLLVTFLPFIAIGAILDFILSRNTGLDKGLKLFAQLLPSGVFLLQAITAFLDASGKTSYGIFNYAIWLFLTAPFFIASYQKESHSKKMLSSLIGCGIIVVIYLFLATKTDALSGGTGALIDFVSYFFVLYSASGIRKLPFLGAILGILNAAAMLLLYFIPMTEATKSWGWDYEFYSNIELLIIITILLSIISCLFASLQKEKDYTVANL